MSYSDFVGIVDPNFNVPRSFSCLKLNKSN